jgi:hypothetical protein
MCDAAFVERNRMLFEVGLEALAQLDRTGPLISSSRVQELKPIYDPSVRNHRPLRFICFGV